MALERRAEMNTAHKYEEEIQVIAEFGHALRKAQGAYEKEGNHEKYCEHLLKLGIGLVVITSAFQLIGDDFLVTSAEALRLELFDRVADVTDLKLFVERINEDASMQYAEFMSVKRMMYH